MSVDDFTVRVEFDDAITVGKIVELPFFVNNQIKGKPIKMKFKETKNKMCVLVPDKFNNYKNCGNVKGFKVQFLEYEEGPFSFDMELYQEDKLLGVKTVTFNSFLMLDEENAPIVPMEMPQTETKQKEPSNDFTCTVKFEDIVTIGKLVDLPLEFNNQIEGKGIFMRYKTSDNDIVVDLPERQINYTNKGKYNGAKIMFNKYEEGPFSFDVDLYQQDKVIATKTLQFEVILMNESDDGNNTVSDDAKEENTAKSDTVQTTQSSKKKKKGKGKKTTRIIPNSLTNSNESNEVAQKQEEVIDNDKEGSLNDFTLTVSDCDVRGEECEVVLFMINLTSNNLTLKYSKSELTKGFTIQGAFEASFEPAEENYTVFVIRRKDKSQCKCEGNLIFALKSNNGVTRRIEVPINFELKQTKKKSNEFFPALKSVKKDTEINKVNNTISNSRKYNLLQEKVKPREISFYNLMNKLTMHQKLVITKKVLELINKGKVECDINLFNIIIDKEISLKNIKENKHELERSFSKITSFFIDDDEVFDIDCLIDKYSITQEENKPEENNEDKKDNEQLKQQKEQEQMNKMIYAIGTILYCVLNGKFKFPYWLWQEKKNEVFEAIKLPVQESDTPFTRPLQKLITQCWNKTITIQEVIKSINELIPNDTENEKNFNELQTLVKTFKDEESERVKKVENELKEFTTANRELINSIEKAKEPKQSSIVYVTETSNKEKQKALMPTEKGNGMKYQRQKLSEVVKSNEDFLKEITSLNNYKQKAVSIPSRKKSSSMPYITSLSKYMFVYQVDNAVFGVYISNSQNNNGNCHFIQPNEYKVFSLCNQYETKPFVFEGKKELKFRIFGRNGSDYFKFDDFITVKNNPEKVEIRESDFDMLVACGLESPSTFLSSNKKASPKPVLKDYREFILYEWE